MMQLKQWKYYKIGKPKLIASAAVFALSCSTLYATEKENVILILVDDLGWADLSCNGSVFYETPNIDKLAQRGIFFSNAYAAAPVSAPARGAILSGKYPARTGYTGLSGQWGRPSKGKYVDADFTNHLPLKEVTIAEELKSHNYATYHLGKWHVGDGEDYSPLKQGFDSYITGFEQGKWKEQRFDEKGNFITDVLTNKAISIIEESKEQPFYLNLWYYAVHTPIRAKKKDIAYFEEKAKKMHLDTMQAFVIDEEYPSTPWFKKGNQQERIKRRVLQSDPVYAAFLYCLDENIGRLMNKLDSLQLTKNTTVIFYSDNGGLSSAEGSPTCNAPLREGKGWNFEGGLRVPLIVVSPRIEVTNRNGICTAPVVGTDLYPTILDILKLPLKPAQHIDGYSFFPLLKKQKMKRPPIFFHSPHYFNNGGYPFSGMIDGCWKYVKRYDINDTLLYNLCDDIEEKNNKASIEKKQIKRIEKKLDVFLNEVHAKYPIPAKNYETK